MRGVQAFGRSGVRRGARGAERRASNPSVLCSLRYALRALRSEATYTPNT
jgi:hypothetical protein